MKTEQNGSIIAAGFDETTATPIASKTNFQYIELLELPTAFVETSVDLPSINARNFIRIVDPVIFMPSSFKKGLSASILYSPDFSTVNSDFLKVGNIVGVAVEYRLSNRFVLQTGIIKSLKYYSANPSEYR